VNKSLEQLIKISKLDNQISSFEPQINAQNEKLQQFMALANKLKSEVQEAQTIITDATTKKSKNNIHLSELNAKIKDVAKKMDSISTQKEAKALQLEEEIAREQISFTNEEIVRLDNIIELKESTLIELSEKLAIEEETVKELDIAISQEINTLDTLRGEVSSKRENILASVDVKVLSFYQKIKRWAGDTAVVPVKKQACYGCFMKLSDKVYAGIIKSNDIIPCPHCGRVLYKDIEAEEV
jgi:predicted  nucleic acid-binding Zn-ribbon protein